MTLTIMLIELSEKGCYPSIHRRGLKWRAHINVAGNYWSDADSPKQALCEAFVLWEKAGFPVERRRRIKGHRQAGKKRNLSRKALSKKRKQKE